MITNDINIVGGGLAGCESAWQAAERGLRVKLFEMRPYQNTGAHTTDYLAELVCSNSLGSNLVDRASGLLKQELRIMGSLLIDCADKCAVPAGGALAVDRELFASTITNRIINHPNIQVIREEIREIPVGPTIIASGPLTSSRFSVAIAEFTGKDHLFFFDAIAPIISHDSIDLETAFRSSRYQEEKNHISGSQVFGDYINCPMEEDEYHLFISELLTAERIPLREFEKELELGVNAGNHLFFEGCLPVEILAQRGKNSLAFGPLRPVGLKNPKTGKRPYAVVQLRQDNLANTLYNMVGFQTNLTFKEQKRIFRLIPGLNKAIFVRYGQMHKNTFIFSPSVLSASLQSLNKEDLFFAGQITGVEGYAGNIATGLLAGINMARFLRKESLLVLPTATMIGALCHYITNASEKDFQPMKANFGILPDLNLGNKKTGRRQRSKLYAERSIDYLDRYITNQKCV